MISRRFAASKVHGVVILKMFATLIILKIVMGTGCLMLWNLITRTLMAMALPITLILMMMAMEFLQLLNVLTASLVLTLMETAFQIIWTLTTMVMAFPQLLNVRTVFLAPIPIVMAFRTI